MIEKRILDYLAETLNVPVGMEVPDPMPETFVTVEKTGSGLENHIRSATLAIQSWGPSLYEAAALNERVKTAMLEADSLPFISRSALNSDYNYTDESTKFYRYQAVFDLVHY